MSTDGKSGQQAKDKEQVGVINISVPESYELTSNLDPVSDLRNQLTQARTKYVQLLVEFELSKLQANQERKELAVTKRRLNEVMQKPSQQDVELILANHLLNICKEAGQHAYIRHKYAGEREYRLKQGRKQLAEISLILRKSVRDAKNCLSEIERKRLM